MKKPDEYKQWQSFNSETMRDKLIARLEEFGIKFKVKEEENYIGNTVYAVYVKVYHDGARE